MAVIDIAALSKKGMQANRPLARLTNMLSLAGHANIAKQVTPEWFMFIRKSFIVFICPYSDYLGLPFYPHHLSKKELRWEGIYEKEVKRLMLPAILISALLSCCATCYPA